ncbi:MAG: UvrD-helicase domain-containing protein, partial [Actinomycetota bacterium]
MSAITGTFTQGDIIATIQGEQDQIIRSPLAGVLLVQGGPGTGKTAVALHRAAYLLYSDSRIIQGGGVLFVGPTEGYLAYVDDVLPSLGEDSVQVCTLRELVVEGATASVEADPAVAELKSSTEVLKGVEAAVAYY